MSKQEEQKRAMQIMHGNLIATTQMLAVPSIDGQSSKGELKAQEVGGNKRKKEQATTPSKKSKKSEVGGNKQKN